jgi:hypothetical protein
MKTAFIIVGVLALTGSFMAADRVDWTLFHSAQLVFECKGADQGGTKSEILLRLNSNNWDPLELDNVPIDEKTQANARQEHKLTKTDDAYTLRTTAGFNLEYVSESPSDLIINRRTGRFTWTATSGYKGGDGLWKTTTVTTEGVCEPASLKKKF